LLNVLVQIANKMGLQKEMFLLQMEMPFAATTPVIFSTVVTVGFVSCLQHLPVHSQRP
jgi:hypothetical protein